MKVVTYHMNDGMKITFIPLPEFNEGNSEDYIGFKDENGYCTVERIGEDGYKNTSNKENTV